MSKPKRPHLWTGGDDTLAKGARAERRVRDELKAAGWPFVQRSWMSQSAADLVAIRPGSRPVLIQVRSAARTMTPEERATLLDTATRADCTAVHAIRRPGSAITLYRRLTGLGPKEWKEWSPGDGDT